MPAKKKTPTIADTLENVRLLVQPKEVTIKVVYQGTAEFTWSTEDEGYGSISEDRLIDMAAEMSDELEIISVTILE